MYPMNTILIDQATGRPAPQLIDPFGREITYLRVSVTDRCDFRCVYCMAEDMTFLPKREILTLEELDRLCSAFVTRGVRKLRLTGGEPLAQRESFDLIRRLCDETGTLLIYDEIQCGLGRTGHLFAFHRSGVVPDMVTLAKVPMRPVLKRAPSEYFRTNIAITTSGVNWHEALLFAQRTVGVDNIMFAIDYPYERTEEAVRFIRESARTAHTPVIWATQVMEGLAKTGRPSRAEISDAAMGERAECVMLTKGPYILDAVQALDNILRRMQTHQRRRARCCARLHLAARFFGIPDP